MKHRVVAATPAGRRRYMRLLVPYILSSDVIDRYDIWINTTDPFDLAFFEAIGKHEKIRLVRQPDGVVNGIRSINAFFRYARDPEEIYIRFDDDIVWIKSDTIARIVEFRVSNPDYFLVAPFIINNAICTSILQTQGKLGNCRKVRPYCLDKNGWESEEFAEQLHRIAIAEIAGGTFSEFSGMDAQFAACRFSINCISWFGADLGAYDQIFSGSDELQISYAIPMLANRSNAVIAETLVSHFAFYTQREHLDKTDILQSYHNIRNNSKWLSQDAVEFVEQAYDSVGEGAEADRQSTASELASSLIRQEFGYPIGIKTKKTSIARLFEKASRVAEKLNLGGR